MKRKSKYNSLEQAFWAGVNKGNEDECWVWHKGRNQAGYGEFTYLNQKHWAHRVAYELFNGRITERNVCHKCDNRACCNPAHLYEATQRENMKDAVAKGRISALILNNIKRGEITKADKALRHQIALNGLRKRIQRVVGPIEISDEALERFNEGDGFAAGNTLHVGRERDAMGHFI
jgi:hypothetical protein